MAHWTDAQHWTNTATGERLTAGELIKRFDRFFRVNRLSLCCLPAGTIVRGEDDSKWTRDRE